MRTCSVLFQNNNNVSAYTLVCRKTSTPRPSHFLKVVQEYMRKLRISTDNGMPSFISVSNSVTKPFSYKVDSMPYYMHEMVINEVCCGEFLLSPPFNVLIDETVCKNAQKVLYEAWYGNLPQNYLIAQGKQFLLKRTKKQREQNPLKSQYYNVKEKIYIYIYIYIYVVFPLL